MRERRAHQRSIQITVPTSVVVGAMIGQTIAVFWQEDLAAATQFTPAASTGIAIASHLKTLPRQTVALQDQYPNRSSFGLRGLVWEVLLISAQIMQLRGVPCGRLFGSEIPRLYLTGREPVIEDIHESLRALLPVGLDATLETPMSARSRSNGSRSLRMSPLLIARFTNPSITPWI